MAELALDDVEPRPYREAIAPDRAAEMLAEQANAGQFDADAVAAVVESAGQQAPPLERPAGLSEREAEVVGMLARGLQTKQVARTLGISVKTRGPAHPERLPQDGRLDARRSDPVRDGARPGGMGRTPDCLSDPASALAETRRVLRPGGRVSLAVWGALERNPFFTVVATALTQLGHLPPPEPSGPPVFSLGSPEGTRVLLERAGFSSVRTEEVPVLFELAGVDEYLGLVGDTAGPA